MSDKRQDELFRKALYIVQLFVGSGREKYSDEYLEKIDIVREQLEKIYQMGYAHAIAGDIFRRETVRPPAPPGDWDVEIDLTKDD